MEGKIIKSIQLALSKHGSKLFRNNTGTGWIGDRSNISGGIIIKDPRPLKAGLCVGSSDLIGWTPIEITSEMVGKKVAIFTAIEVKKPGGRLTPKQANFINAVLKDGGFSYRATSDEESLSFIKQQRDKLNGIR